MTLAEPDLAHVRSNCQILWLISSGVHVSPGPGISAYHWQIRSMYSDLLNALTNSYRVTVTKHFVRVDVTRYEASEPS